MVNLDCAREEKYSSAIAIAIKAEANTMPAYRNALFHVSARITSQYTVFGSRGAQPAQIPAGIDAVKAQLGRRHARRVPAPAGVVGCPACKLGGEVQPAQSTPAHPHD